jgi:CrcB protein
VTVLLVALGAAAGSPLRYLAGHFLDGSVRWGTILVNVGGSFLLGVFSGLALSGAASALLGVGFCGGLTTFSAFAVQTHDLGPRRGTLNVLLTIPPALLACGLGFLLAA